MKITQVQFMEAVRVGKNSESGLLASKGHEIHFENGLIVVTLDSHKVFVPMSNVRCWIVADEAQAKAKAVPLQELAEPTPAKRGRPAKAE